MISAWSRSAKLLTRYEARRIAANHRQAGGAAAAEVSVQNRDVPDVRARPSSRARGSGLHADVYTPPFASIRRRSGACRNYDDTLVESARDFVFAGVTIARRVWVAISHLGDGCAVGPIIPGRGTVLGRAVTQCEPIQVSDVEADPEYTL
jgi:hypothetical protein